MDTKCFVVAESNSLNLFSSYKKKKKMKTESSFFPVFYDLEKATAKPLKSLKLCLHMKHGKNVYY